MNDGKCELLQVGVKAPGTANKITFFSENYSSVSISLGSPLPTTVTLLFGNISPSLIIFYILKGTQKILNSQDFWQ